MNLRSIRWRLPLSYAAIALLATLALGSVLLLVLGEYYARQEREYLLGNATGLQPILEDLLVAGTSPDTMQSIVEGMSFLSQTRIRVLDAAGTTKFDSGIPKSNQMVALASGISNGVLFSMPGGSEPQDSPPISVDSITPSVPGDDPSFVIGGQDTVLMVNASPLGYAFQSLPTTRATSSASEHRSKQVISLSLSDLLGSIEISAGPAYGRDIIRSVSLAWAGAGVVAVLLAGMGGWFASRRFTQPVLILTGATQRMESGDLSARVGLTGKNPAAEFQALAHSFNGMAGQVEATVSTLRAFVADAAHELHTPLTALRTNLELASEEKESARRILYLEHAQEQGARLEGLVKGLLNLSRLETGQPGPEVAPLVLNHLLAEQEEQFASRAEQAGSNLTITIPDVPVTIIGNQLQLRQAITNLFENALKFTPQGGEINIELSHLQGEAVITVADTGIGVPPEDLPHLFERFHRGRNASAYPGSGLGLAITRAIVHTHGGSIQAESSLGEGMKVTIKLPLA